jgi:serine transporter
VDFGWIILSIGMAIGAGIVFLPVQAGLVGLWVFLASALIAYPALYLFQRLFINTIVESEHCCDYPEVITGYLGKNWGIVIGLLYFVMLTIWVFVYSTAVTNDSASYLHTFGVTSGVLSEKAWYPLALITALVLIASRGEAFLFKVSTVLVLTKLGIVGFLGISMIKLWNPANIAQFPSWEVLVKETIITLPFTLTSILFLQTLSPMVISYRARSVSRAVARHKALRAMNIAFGVLFVTVFFYAVSFTLALGHADAERAYRENISALALAAQLFKPGLATVLGIILNIFALVTAFFGVFLGFEEACRGLALNVLRRFVPEESLSRRWIDRGVRIFLIVLAWFVVTREYPVLSFTSICSPIFGLIGCLIPAWLVIRVPALAQYRTPALGVIIFAGILLVVSPFLNFWK